MNSLGDLQAEFAGALRDPERPAPPAIRRAAGTLQTRRFDVYRNNFTVSLIEALEATFPAVRKLVGEAFFKACARVFIDAEPPRSPVLLLYGRGFGDFLDGFEPADTVPYLGDVARLEWARLRAFHAADEDCAGIEGLGAIDATRVEAVTFGFHPSFSLIRSRWPVVSLWSASTSEEESSEVDMACAQDALVVRSGIAVDVRIAPDGAADFIAALMAGETLGSAAALAADAMDDDFDLSGHLGGLFAIGAIARIIPPRSTKG